MFQGSDESLEQFVQRIEITLNELEAKYDPDEVAMAHSEGKHPVAKEVSTKSVPEAFRKAA